VTTPAPRPGIMDIKPYIGGESAIKGVDRIIKLSSNEGALGPSPKAQAAYAAIAADLHRYPDGSAATLRAAIAQRYGLDAERIVCGAGSDELLGILCRAYAGPGDEVLYSRHGFLMYAIAAKACGANPVTAPEIDLTASVDNLLAAVTPRTKIVFLANPNNPTGTYVAASDVARLRQNLPPHVLLVIDAAYAEFVDKDNFTSGLELVDGPGANTVVARTFSKIYALGGLRLGWVYCPEAVAGVLNRVRNPFNVGAPALAAGLAALEDEAHTALCKSHNDTWLPWLTARLGELGLATTPSVCNFVLVRFPAEIGGAAAADAFLRAKGIITRAMGGYGLGEWLRITIGQADENALVVAALTEFLAPRK